MKADRRRHFASEVEHRDTQHADLRASKKGPMDLHQASDGRTPPRLTAMPSVSSRSLWYPSRSHSPTSGESESEVEMPSAMTSSCSFIPVPCDRPILLTDRTSGSLSSRISLLSPPPSPHLSETRLPAPPSSKMAWQMASLPTCPFLS
jgi:hypothetical protein